MARIDPDTLGWLFDEYGRSLLLLAREWCDAPDDIVQDAFVALARQDVVPDQVVPWLYRVVRNGAIAVARQTSRRRRREQRAATVEAVRSETWFASTDAQIDAQHASQLLADLDGETREAIIARLWGGLTFEEIAQPQGKIAALRVVEALRMHAAAHNGILPESLDQITDVPVPEDPATGEPFIYRAADGAAILHGPRAGLPVPPTYRITIRH